MSVPAITAQQFLDQLNQSIASRNDSYDLSVGPVPDLITYPLSKILEDQNARVRQIQDLITLVASGNYTDDDLNDFVLNEGIIRNTGARASCTAIFFRSTPPGSDLTVKSGYPVGTAVDEQTGSAYTFVVLQDTTMVVANIGSYYNPDKRRYELQVPVQATVAGSGGNVGASRITRLLRPLNNFEGVTNYLAASGGLDGESNAQLIRRYLIAVTGSNSATVNGIEKLILDNYSNVTDVYVAFGTDPLLTRAATDAGAVDVWLLGSTSVNRTDTTIFPGVSMPIPLDFQPVSSVSSVVYSTNTYVFGTDYIFVPDTSGLSNSIKAQDAIQFLPGASSPPVGAPLTIVYTQNELPQFLTNEFLKPDLNIPGRDILFRIGEQENIVLSATLTILAGFNTSTVQNAVTSAISNLVNGLNLGQAVQLFDIETAVGRVDGVDNFIITALAVSGQTPANPPVDLTIAGNAYARIQTSDITLTVTA